MNYTGFILKLVAFAAILGILYQYQTIATVRAGLEAENEAKIAEVEEYNRQIKQENARREAEAAAAEGREIEIIYYYKNGTFEGSGNGYGGPIKVAVTIEEDVMTDISVLSHDAEDAAYYVLAEGLTEEILSTQSTDIDAASGATFSSKGIIEAVDAALTEAVNE